MAQRIGSVYVSLDVDVGGVSRYSRAADRIERDGRRMRRSLGQNSRSLDILRGQMSRPMRQRMFAESLRTITRTNDEVQRLRASFVALSVITGTGLTGALSAAYLLQTADRARLLSNQLKTVTDGTADLNNIQEQLYHVSQRTRSSFDATTRIYARTARATEFLSTSQEDLLRITETVQKAFAVGGATQAEATGAAIQLSQGIASDRFSGEEFRSVAENAPVLLQAMARHLGVNIGKLREMAHAGELTAKVVTEAILNSSNEIDNAFNKTIATVGQALTRLDNAFLQYIGDVDESYGLTERLSKSISNLAENFDEVARYASLAMLGAGSVFVGRQAGLAVADLRSDFHETLRNRQRELDVLREQTKEIDAQRTALNGRIALERASYAQSVTASKAANLSAAERHRFNVANQKQLQRINTLRKEGIALTRASAQKTQELAFAQRQATVAATAGRAVVGFFGGPVGIALTAAVAGMVLYARHSAKAAQETENITRQLEHMGYLTAGAADEMERFNKSVEEGRVAQLQQEAGRFNEELQRRKRELEGLRLNPDLSLNDELRKEFAFADVNRVRELAAGLDETRNKIAAIRDAMVSTGGRSDELDQELQQIASSAPEFAPVISKIIELGELFEALSTAANDYADAVERAQLNISSQDPKLFNAMRSSRREDARDNFFGDRDAVGTFEAQLEERTQKILQEAEKVDVQISQFEARARARLELTREVASKGLLDLVALAEGTARGRGYNETLDYGRWTDGDRNLVSMTLNEVLELQRQMLANPENRALYGDGRGSSAVGRYQITRATLRDLIAELGLEGNERFDADMQDRLAEQLIRRRGRSVEGLRNEWEGLRGVDERSILGAFDTSSLTMSSVDASVEENIALRKRQQEAIDRLKGSLEGAISAQRIEAQVLGKADQSRIAALKSMEIEQQLLRQGIEITPQLRSEIESLAAAYAQSAVALQQAEEQQELSLELQKERIEFARDITGGLMSDLRQGLMQGEDAWEAFGSTASRALDKIADKLQDDVLDALFQVNKASSIGGGGGFLSSLFGSFGGLFAAIFHEGGIAGGPAPLRLMPARAFAGAPRFHGGFGSDELPAVLRRGERVLTEQADRRVIDTIDGLTRAAASDRGGHITVDVTTRVENGNLVPLVAAVSGRVAGQMVKQADRNFASRVQQVQARRT